MSRETEKAPYEFETKPFPSRKERNEHYKIEAELSGLMTFIRQAVRYNLTKLELHGFLLQLQDYRERLSTAPARQALDHLAEEVVVAKSVLEESGKGGGMVSRELLLSRLLDELDERSRQRIGPEREKILGQERYAQVESSIEEETF